jgi:hypothetical protein
MDLRDHLARAILAHAITSGAALEFSVVALLFYLASLA